MHGLTPLHIAVMREDLDCVQALVRRWLSVARVQVHGQQSDVRDDPTAHRNHAGGPGLRAGPG